jgi:hypothetical protein
MVSARAAIATLGIAVAGALGLFAGGAMTQDRGDHGDWSEYPVGDTSLVYAPGLDQTLPRDKSGRACGRA